MPRACALSRASPCPTTSRPPSAAASRRCGAASSPSSPLPPRRSASRRPCPTPPPRRKRMSDQKPNPPPPRRGRIPAEPPAEATREEILRLHDLGLGTRKIRDRLGVSRQVVTTVLEATGRLDSTTTEASKLRLFHDAIAKRVELGLSTSRILREIQTLGYQGGRTILADHVRPLRARLALSPMPGVKRRFETPPGQEMQIDWSPYLVPIDGRLTRVHALGCLLCASRKLHLRFYSDERQATLLEALACAFAYFDGVAHKLGLDNKIGRAH